MQRASQSREWPRAIIACFRRSLLCESRNFYLERGRAELGQLEKPSGSGRGRSPRRALLRGSRCGTGLRGRGREAQPDTRTDARTATRTLGQTLGHWPRSAGPRQVGSPAGRFPALPRSSWCRSLPQPELREFPLRPRTPRSSCAQLIQESAYSKKSKLGRQPSPPSPCPKCFPPLGDGGGHAEPVPGRGHLLAPPPWAPGGMRGMWDGGK